MNTKHKNYKKYLKVHKEYIAYENPVRYEWDYREQELWDELYSDKFRNFTGPDYKGTTKSMYARHMNKQDKTCNKKALFNILKLTDIESDAITYKTEFRYHHKNGSWMLL